ncbi:MAG: metallophosphoesterase [Bacillota bacterium]
MKPFSLKSRERIFFNTVRICIVALVYFILGYFFEFKGHLRDVVSFMIFLIPNYFIGYKGWNYIGRRMGMNRIAYWGIYWFVALSYIPGKIIDKFLPDSMIANAFLLLDSYWFNCLRYFLVIILFCMLLGFLNKRFNFLGAGMGRLVGNTPFVGLVVLVLTVSYLAYGTWNSSRTQVTHYEITINKNTTGLKELRAVMVSDLHLGRFMSGERLKGLVSSINKLKPDVVLVVGDTIEEDNTPYIKRKMADILAGINSKHGVYAVLGNHEAASGNTDVIIENLNKAGISVLKDQYIIVADSFYLVGRSDRGEVGENSDRKKLDSIIEGIDKSLPILLMDHQPVEFDGAADSGIDIQLSGHTHDGQEIFAKPIVSLAFDLAYGYYNKNNFHAIVSSGFGTWGSPVRVGTKSEIVDIHIRFNSSSE